MAHFRNNYHFARTLNINPELRASMERIEKNFQDIVTTHEEQLAEIQRSGHRELIPLVFNKDTYTSTALMVIQGYLNCGCREGAMAIRDELQSLSHEFPNIPILWEAAQEANKRLG